MLRRLERRFKRWRYSARLSYPRLFVVFAMCKLPMQLALVAVPLWLLVGVYNKHFSYEAHSNRIRSLQVNNEVANPSIDSGNIVVIDRSLPVNTTANNDADSFSSDNALSAVDQKKITATATEPGDTSMALALESRPATEPALTQVLSTPDGPPGESLAVENSSTALTSAEKVGDDSFSQTGGSAPELLPADANVKVTTVPFAAIEELPDSGVIAQDLLSAPDKRTRLSAVMEQLSGPTLIQQGQPEPALPADTVKGADWLAGQNDASYVIQVESSANQRVMQRKAQNLSVAGDLAIYPFVVSREGEVIYGMSYGLYDTLDDARQASNDLPTELLRYGAWIRQVGTLKRQIRVIEQAR
ncbi:MAG: SPOR domain-containing protein [Pseudomonadota bacterium]